MSFTTVITIHILFQYFVKIKGILTCCEFAGGIVIVISFYIILKQKNATYLNKLKQIKAKTKFSSHSILLFNN